MKEILIKIQYLPLPVLLKNLLKIINNDYIIIINSAHINDSFKKYENNFKGYIYDIDVDVEVIHRSKNSRIWEVSFLVFIVDKNKLEGIFKASIQNNLRNIVIRESIDIENLIWNKIKSKNSNLEQLLKVLPTNKNPTFNTKIELFEFYFKQLENIETITSKLHGLRELRNEFAHETESDNIKTLAKSFVKQFEKEFEYDNKVIIGEFLECIEKLALELEEL